MRPSMGEEMSILIFLFNEHSIIHQPLALIIEQLLGNPTPFSLEGGQNLQTEKKIVDMAIEIKLWLYVSQV